MRYSANFRIERSECERRTSFTECILKRYMLSKFGVLPSRTLIVSAMIVHGHGDKVIVWRIVLSIPIVVWHLMTKTSLSNLTLHVIDLQLCILFSDTATNNFMSRWSQLVQPPSILYGQIDPTALSRKFLLLYRIFCRFFYFSKECFL